MSISQSDPEHRPAAVDPIARILDQWEPVIEDMATACGDDGAEAGAARARLEPFLQQIGEEDDWRALVAALRRILAGERDESALVWELDATDHLIVDAVLERLALTQPLPRAGEEPEGGAEYSARAEDSEPQTEQITLDEFLALVARACQPDERDLNAQMYVSARRMAEAEDAPAWQHALGDVLMSILDGQREPDLAALPEALADKVRAIVLGRGEGETE